MKLRFFVLASALFASTMVSCSSVSEIPDSPNYQAVIYGVGCVPTRIAIRGYSGVSYRESSIEVKDIKTGEVFFFTGDIQTVIATPEEVAAYMKATTQKDRQTSLIKSLQERGVVPTCK